MKRTSGPHRSRTTSAIESVRSLVTRVYSGSFLPTELTPRQKKTVSKPAIWSAADDRSKRSGTTTCSSSGESCGTGDLPMTSTSSTRSWSRHSRSTP
jgi:hypothetical protein